MSCRNFRGPSNPTQGKGSGTSFKNPTGSLSGMASGSGAMMGNANHVMNRATNQGKAGGPSFKGSAGNPVGRGR